MRNLCSALAPSGEASRRPLGHSLSASSASFKAMTVALSGERPLEQTRILCKVGHHGARPSDMSIGGSLGNMLPMIVDNHWLCF